jgi:hypothetical protein
MAAHTIIRPRGPLDDPELIRSTAGVTFLSPILSSVYASPPVKHERRFTRLQALRCYGCTIVPVLLLLLQDGQGPASLDGQYPVCSLDYILGSSPLLCDFQVCSLL